MGLGAQHLLDSVPGHIVDEEDKQKDEEDDDDAVDDVPLEALPDDVAHGQERVGEPRERRAWPTTQVSGNLTSLGSFDGQVSSGYVLGKDCQQAPKGE